MKLRYRVEVYEDSEEPGVWLAKVPSVAGVLSDGDSTKEALSNVRDALKAMLLAMQEWGEAFPYSDVGIFEHSVELETYQLDDSEKLRHEVLRHPDGRRTIIPCHREELKQAAYRALLEQIGMTEEEFNAA